MHACTFACMRRSAYTRERSHPLFAYLHFHGFSELVFMCLCIDIVILFCLHDFNVQIVASICACYMYARVYPRAIVSFIRGRGDGYTTRLLMFMCAIGATRSQYNSTNGRVCRVYPARECLKSVTTCSDCRSSIFGHFWLQSLFDCNQNWLQSPYDFNQFWLQSKSDCNQKWK